jgi:lysozyme family protein
VVDDKPGEARFLESVDFVIDCLEGGGRLIRDSGGWTRWGISQKGNPDVDVLDLTRDAAVSLYHDRYWLPCGAPSLPRGLDLLVFDAGVNMGPRVAVKLLQDILAVPADGIPGPRTLGAASHFANQRELRALYNDSRQRAYEQMHGPNRGWRLRTWRVADEAGRVGKP